MVQLGRTIAFYQAFFQQGGGGWLCANDVSVPRKVTPGLPKWNFFVQCPGLIFLAARWSGPAASASIFSVCLDYILRVCKSQWGSFRNEPHSLSGKASLVSICATILFLRSWHVYFPLESECRGKSCVEWEHVSENGILCFLPCILLLYKDWIWTNYCKLSRTSLEQ